MVISLIVRRTVCEGKHAKCRENGVLLFICQEFLIGRPGYLIK